jgi:integrase
MLATGLRVGAASNLRWVWVNRHNWTLTVPKEWDKAKTGFVAAVGTLGRDVLVRRAEQHGTEGRVFPGVSVDTVYYFMKSLGVYPHQLRHTFATNLVPNVSIHVIGSQLGHKDVKTTQRYAKALVNDKVNAVAALSY